MWMRGVAVSPLVAAWPADEGRHRGLGWTGRRSHKLRCILDS